MVPRHDLRSADGPRSHSFSPVAFLILCALLVLFPDATRADVGRALTDRPDASPVRVVFYLSPGASRLSQPSPRSTEDLDPRTALRAGVLFGASLRQRFGAHLGVFYALTGTRLQREYPLWGEEHIGDPVPWTERRTLALHYLTVPLQVHYTFRSGGTRPYLMAGPEAALLFQASNEVRLHAGPYRHAWKDDVSSSLSRGDLGFHLAAGLVHPFGEKGWLVELGYSQGFVEIGGERAMGNEGVDSAYYGEGKNRSVTLGVGLQM